MVKFKCTASGNIFEFKYEHDIAAMLKHPGYVQVSDEKAEETEQNAGTDEKVPTKRKYTRKNQG